MCMQTDVHVRLVYWGCVAGLLLIFGFSCLGYSYSKRAKQKFDSYGEFLDSYMSMLCAMVMVVSVLVIIACGSAMVSIIMDWYPLLVTHGFILGFLGSIGLIVGVYITFTARNLQTKAGTFLHIVGPMYEVLNVPDNLNPQHSIIQNLERDMECCGVFHFMDYTKNTREHWARDLVPLSRTCCIDPDDKCEALTDKEYYKEGCLGVLVVYTASTFSIFGVSTCLISIKLIIDCVLIFVLAKRAKEFYHFYPYYIS